MHDPPAAPAPSYASRPAPRVRQAKPRLASRWDVLLVIAAGGALGSLGRWAIAAGVPATRESFAWATWVENITGAFALGLVMVFAVDVWPPSRYLRPFLGVGVLGGYTTFSTYMLDARGLLATGHVPVAAAYVFGTMAAGLAAVWLGIMVARLVVEGTRRGRARGRPREVRRREVRRREVRRREARRRG